MMIPILTTKLHIPRSQLQAVSRPHLIKKLDAGVAGKLTLISAPAGSGKSTLISEWLAHGQYQVAWLSLDEDDQDPVRFLTYLIAALQTVVPHTGDSVLNVLQSAQSLPIPSMMITLINEIAMLPDKFILVLDDYHALENKAIDDAVDFLIEHMPRQMHFVIITREDPPLALARLRARRQLTELRASDLRFSLEETTVFLNQIMKLSLADDVIAHLEARTEGWIAGLQMAALSMHGQQDIPAFIQSFTGNHHFIFDYLLEEVLHQQPEHIQTFLLHTSMLEHLCGSLCDAVLQNETYPAQQSLETIRQGNLFLIPLDHERRWYRYHHLFAGLLRQRLQQHTAAPVIKELHRRASDWYESNGFPVEAFHHAAAAGDIDRAIHLINSEAVPLHYRGVITPILDWLVSLPDAAIDDRPALRVMLASVLTMRGEPAYRVEQHLNMAEDALQNQQLTKDSRDLIGQIAANRAMLAIPSGQLQTIITQSHHALQYLHPDNLSVRTTVSWMLGLAYQIQGDLAAAHQAYTDALAVSKNSGNIMMMIATATGLAQVQETQNQLYQAAEVYQQVLQIAGNPPLPYACEAYLGLARIHYQWNDIDTAQTYGQQSLDLAQQLPNVDTPVACGIFLVHLNLAQGKIAEANTIWEQTEHVIHQNHFEQWTQELAAAQVALLLRDHNLTAAARIAQHFPFSLARVYLAQENPSAALEVLESLYQQSAAKGRGNHQLNTLILQALAYHVQGTTERAVTRLHDALLLAKPGGFIRIFVDEGQQMAELLAEAADQGIMPHYIARLLAAFEADPETRTTQGRSHAELIEVLTPREQDVLKLIVAGYSNPEIAAALFIGVTTVKTHARNIYGKLQVDNRTQAVARAKDLNLVH